MGSLSRTFDSWRNHVHLHARNLGPGGQMATLMHEELESISGHARQMASLQQQGIETMEAGFNQMNDAVGHLAWVQQRAHEEQLTAQYRVMQLQADTIGELARANETLAVMSTQLAEVADILREIKGTQDEHLQIVKAERRLKEVLFQLTTMLEDMILPEDEVARLCLCQVALDALDHHGLNTSHLSDLADKRAFADFVKSTRKTVRDTPPEVQSDLLAFEVWYKGYKQARVTTPSPFTPLPPPLWQPQIAPRWIPQKGPQWEERAAPTLQLKTLRPRPEERVHPGDHPLPQQFGPMPKQTCGGGKLANLTPYPYLDVQQGFFTPDNVPSYDETRQRFPRSARGVWEFLDSVVMSNEWKNAKRFEYALQDWAEKVRAHEHYVADLAAWEKEAAETAVENDAIEKTHFPAELEQFRVVEAGRRRQYEAERAAFEADEEQRRAAYDRDVLLFEEKEQQRHAAWQAQTELHARNEEKRLQEWNRTNDGFVSALRAQGKRINEFLEEHPDVHVLYSKVDWERDALAYKQRIPPISLGYSAVISEKTAGDAGRVVRRKVY